MTDCLIDMDGLTEAVKMNNEALKVIELISKIEPHLEGYSRGVISSACLGITASMLNSPVSVSNRDVLCCIRTILDEMDGKK